MSKVLSAVAWPYANGPRHIGHVAGFGVPSDVFSRYMRMAGHDVLMVSGTDEHGTPILIAADEAGRDPAGARRPQPPADRRGPRARSGSSYDLYTRTTTRNHNAVVQELFTGVHDNGYFVEQTTRRRDLPVDGPHPARPLHRGHLPDLRLRRRARRPVRQLRQPARPADLIDPRSRINGETPEFVETQHFFLDLPALADALKEWLDEREATRHLAAQRDPVQPEHPRGHPAAGDDPRHRLGHPGAARRLARQPDQAALRVVRRRHRLPVGVASSGRAAPATRTAGGSGGTDPTGSALSYYFMGKDNITFHCQIWPAELLAYAGKGDRGGEPGEYGELNLPTEVVSSRVPHHGGQEVLLVAARGDLRPRPAQPLPARRASATSSPPPGRRTRTPTSPGRSSYAAPTTSWSRAGATWSTAPPT